MHVSAYQGALAVTVIDNPVYISYYRTNIRYISCRGSDVTDWYVICFTASTTGQAPLTSYVHTLSLYVTQT